MCIHSFLNNFYDKIYFTFYASYILLNSIYIFLHYFGYFLLSNTLIYFILAYFYISYSKSSKISYFSSYIMTSSSFNISLNINI